MVDHTGRRAVLHDGNQPHRSGKPAIPREYRHLAQRSMAAVPFVGLRSLLRPNLKAWGFNTVGWVQEVTVGSGGIRAPLPLTSIARWTCPIAICSRSPSHINGRSTPSTTISAEKSGRNGWTTLRDPTARSLRTTRISSATSTATARHGLTTGQTTNGEAQFLIPSG